MMESLDIFLFHKINRDWTHPLFDVFFPFWTDILRTNLFLYGLLPILLIVVFYFWRSKGLAALLIASVTANLADWILREFIKPYFARPRPTDMILRVAEHTSFSFPSGHSTIAFCLMIYFCYFHPRLSWIYLLIAFSIAYSRVYVGVHYPADVLAGALYGGTFGLGFAWTTNHLYAKFWKRR